MLNPIDHEEFRYNTAKIKSLVNHKFNARHLLRGGVSANRLGYALQKDHLDGATWELSPMIKEDGFTYSGEAFIQWRFRPSNRINLNTGIHYLHLFLNNNYSIEPRFGIKWSVADNHTLAYGTGFHSRLEPISIYLGQQETEEGIIYPNKYAELAKAYHNVVSYDWSYNKNSHLKLEVYYQYLYNVPVLNDSLIPGSPLNINSGFSNDDFVNEGYGYNYGLEVTLERSFSDNYYFLLTSSLFDAKYKALDGKLRNTIFNSNYIFNVLGGKEFNIGKLKENVFGANVRFIWRGGYRDVPVDLEQSRIMNSAVYRNDQYYEGQLPYYLRLDIGLNYRMNKPKYSWTVSLDIQNVTARSNVFNRGYDANSGEIEYFYSNGRLPAIFFIIEF